MTRFALTLEFDGGPFMGLQRQKHGPSVQQAVEEAVHAITHQHAAMHAAGRTDAGVHAIAMRAHIDVDHPRGADHLRDGLNAKLRPAPVAVTDCVVVPDEWHARFSCTGRRYLYRIANRRAPLTLDLGRAWQMGIPLDAEAMHDAGQVLIGHHDFTTFRSTACQAKSPMRTLDRLDVERVAGEIHVHAAARSFLHHQVRSMVGCLVRVGMGRWTKGDLADALAARDRQRLAMNAPPQGLYFVDATYDPD
ncbi:tRNA pseudouridine(38-40) synthase TruA [uncultured Croceicoccus sp.]|uniref:tRNA pseudouridine(38-40) synthase TruA n=1 Tax=uncultured Croceicoccus sp. TaxID=1295329 RepID=UPI002611A764|nr:tRNA pseudouridine(38-40) synthase TruA [uncultured Croceicoccus sp.]